MQHGAYRLMIDLYMDTGGPLRNDLPYLYRWLHAESVEEKAAIEYILGEFFQLIDGKWHHKRCNSEILWMESKSRAAQDSIRARWTYERNTNVLPTKNERNTIQIQIQKQIQNKSKSKSSLSEFDSRISDDIKKIIEHLNQKTGKRFRMGPEHRKLIGTRLKTATVAECIAVIDLKAKHWLYDPMMRDYLRPATLFNATKFAQYLGEIDASSNEGMLKLRDTISSDI